MPKVRFQRILTAVLPYQSYKKLDEIKQQGLNHCHKRKNLIKTGKINQNAKH